MTDQNDYKDRFERLTTFLQRTLECPVCLEIVKAQFRVCSRGHAVCLDCLKDFTTCPTCDAPFTLENLICLKNFLEVLPKFCCYSDAGCGEVVDLGGDHETFCGFRPITCTVDGCFQEMCIKAFKSHMANVHFDKLITEEFFSLEGDWDNNVVYRTPVLLFNSFFWLIEKADVETGQLNILLGKSPIEKSCHDYYVKIKMKHGKFSYTHTLKAVLINDLHGNEDYTADEMKAVTGVHCMKIPLCEISHFRDSAGAITRNYTFFKADTRKNCSVEAVSTTKYLSTMADQNNYKERFRCLTTLLEKSRECPICLDTVKYQFKICSRGHAVCLHCLKDLTMCPTCDAPFTIENIICLKNVLEVLPKFCRYSDAGCEEILDPGGDHETLCGFRPFTCTYDDCDQEMCVKDFISHMEEVHLDENSIIEEFKSLNRGWNNNVFYRTPVFLFNSLFWLIEKADQETGHLYIIFGKTPIEKSHHNYYVKIKMKQGPFSYTHTLKAELINDILGNELCTDVMIRDITGAHCIKIPLSELSRFRDLNGMIPWSYTFFNDDTM